MSAFDDERATPLCMQSVVGTRDWLPNSGMHQLISASIRFESDQILVIAARAFTADYSMLEIFSETF